MPLTPLYGRRKRGGKLRRGTPPRPLYGRRKKGRRR